MNEFIAISAENLVKKYGTVTAVNGVSLKVKSGEIYGLVGPDGAGKTTTLRLLIGALLANEGEAFICGFSAQHQVEQARSMVGYLSQRFSLYEDLTVLENVLAARGIVRYGDLPKIWSSWRTPMEQREALSLLEQVGLAGLAEQVGS